MSETTIHIAFINGDLNHVGIHDGDVDEVARSVMGKAASFDGTTTERLGGNYTGPGGQPIELAYRAVVTLPDGYSAEWRHMFRRPDLPWPTLATRDPSPAGGGSE
jgi:hypothetical protein